jgi:hypothetical protein
MIADKLSIPTAKFAAVVSAYLGTYKFNAAENLES